MSVKRSIARWGFKPPYLVYYRSVYGRRFPGADGRLHAVNSLEMRVARGDTPQPKARWEEKYESGGWAFLRELYELPRYASIAALTTRLRPDAAILDVGCGEGLLQSALKPLGYRSYLGIDLAEAAIEQTADKADERTRFVAADAEEYRTDERFDVVVFNECVHYFRDPVATVSRYETCLEPQGLFILSTFSTPRGEAIMRGLVRRYTVLEETAISHRAGTSVIRVITP